MPTYEYRCKSCDKTIEVVQAFTDDPLTECPSCGGALRKVFGNIGISFKGSGFYKTDSRSSGGKHKDSQHSSSAPSSESSSGDGSSSADGGPSSSSDNGSSDASSDKSGKSSDKAGKSSDKKPSKASAGKTSGD